MEQRNFLLKIDRNEAKVDRDGNRLLPVVFNLGRLCGFRIEPSNGEFLHVGEIIRIGFQIAGKA